jgi:hypothetical protein
MALPAPQIILLAKAYAHRLELGETPAEAGIYLRNRFTAATPAQIRRAIGQAQRAMEVGETLAQMGEQEHLSEALEGRPRPARTVGVRVELSQWLTGQPEGDPWRVNTLYVEAPWDATIADVMERARDWLGAKPGQGYGVRSTVVQFVGPTLWPGGTPGLQI